MPDDVKLSPPQNHQAVLLQLGLLRLCALAIIVGIVTGLGAVLFRDLIGIVHNAFFLGKFAVAYNASVFTPASPWGPLVILVPVIGGLGVTWIVSTFAPEAKGHGVPEVMDAIYYKKGIIRPVVALVKSIASALAIGTGAAVGREGPIIQIGSALGSTLGQLIHMRPGQRITLVAAGAGAGIAATFNTPIGGVMFAMELMLPEVSVDSFLPVAVATGTATFIGRLFFGSRPAFDVPFNLAALPNEPGSALTLMLYVVLGAIVGVAAASFVKVLHWLEDLFDLIPNRYLRHSSGMLLMGLAMYALFLSQGHYFIEGVGYSTIQATLHGALPNAGLLLALAAAKLLATSVSLGSGSSGGVFSPSLFMGATLGAAFAAIVSLILPSIPVSLPAFAMVGMGAMVGGGTGAAMTAVTMIFEMTRDYNMVLPLILAVATALGVRRMISVENMYTMKLVRRGHPVPKSLHANQFLVRTAQDLMTRTFFVLDEGVLFSTFLEETSAHRGVLHVVITKDGSVSGMLRINLSLRRAGGEPTMTLGEIANPDFVVVHANDTALSVIKSMSERRAVMAVVTGADAQDFIGVISKEHIADTIFEGVSLYPA